LSSSLAKTLKLALLSSVVALGVARNADAAYVVINADPVYGTQFPGLGWRATGALYIPDGCTLAAGISSLFWSPFTVTIAGDTSPVDIPLVSALCAGARIQDTTLYFYNTAAPLTMVEAIGIGTYAPDTAPVASANDQSQNLIDFSMATGQVVGFHSTLSAPKHATDLLAGGGANCFSLEFSSDTARLVSYNYVNGACSTTPIAGGQSQNAAQVTIGSFISNAAYRAPVVLPVVATVPEPTSLALALLALGAAATRRRRGASARA